MRMPTRSLSKPLSLALCLALAYPLAHALPQGAQVVQGQAKVSTPQAGQGLIQQSTDKAVINWQGFSIGAGESLRIEQPGVNSVLLNRVVGGDPSLILGRMQSNGQVFLLNPRGIVFGRGSQVDVGGLVASTLDLPDSAFLAGNYSFTAGPGAAGLQADGSITSGGTVALVAPRLDISGSIQARRVGLAAAGSVTVDVEGDGLVLFNLRNDDDRDVALKFSGRIQADGGSAELRAQARGGAAGQVLNMDGIVQARGLRQQGGRIVIDGGTRGDTTVSGSLDATGETGGNVTVLGQRVALLDAARVDASGLYGGGSLQVGGGYQGQGTPHNAERTVISSDAQLRADAIERGDGGRVVVWADQRTDMLGQVTARGGRLGGNGGDVETSGKQQLNMPSGSVDVGAPLGRAGSWLLDPNNISIVTGGGNQRINNADPFVSTDDDAKLGVNLLNSQLKNGVTITVRTASAATNGETGLITVAADIQPTGPATLNLIAQGSILFSGGKILAGPNALNVNLLAGSDATGANPGGSTSSITATGTGVLINTNGGTLGATAKGTISLGNVSSGALTITSNGGDVVLPTGTVAGALNVTTAGGAITQASGGLSVTTGGATLNATGGAITLDQANAIAGTVTLTGGATRLDNTRTASTTLTLGTLNTGALTVNTDGGALNLGSGTVGGALHASSNGGAISQAGALTVTTGGASLNAGTGAGAGSITLDQANGITGTVDLTGGTTRLDNTKTTATTLTLGTLNTGALTVNTNGGGINLGGGSVGGALNAGSANGNIIQASALTVTGGGTLNAGSGTLQLDQANELGGAAFNLTGGATRVDSTKATTSTLTLGTLNTGALTVNTDGGALNLGSGTVGGALHASSNGGAISQAGALTVTTGGASLNAGTGAGAGSITLDQANGITGTVDLTGGTTRLDNTKTTATTLTLGTLNTGALTVNTNGGAINLGGGSVNGALNASSANGNITQTSALTVTGGGTLNAGTGSIQLDQANELGGGAINLTGGSVRVDSTKSSTSTLTLGTLNTGDLTVNTDGGALGLGGGSVTGALNATSAGGAITQSAALTVTGNSTLGAGAGGITLSEANALGGTVTLTGGTTVLANTKTNTTTLTLGTLNTGALTVSTDGGALNLGSGTVGGALQASSHGGAITQAGALTVTTGGAVIDAGSGAITLDQANAITGAVDLTGGTTRLDNTKTTATTLTLGTLNTGDLTVNTSGGALGLGGGTVSGTLNATSAGGAITQGAALTVTGNSTLDAGAGGITLSEANALGGTVTLTGGTAVLANTKTATTTLTLGTLNTGALTVSTDGGALVLGTGTVAGALHASSNGGAITQASGGLTVTTGGAVIDAGSGAITLDQANAITGTVDLTGGSTRLDNTKTTATTLTLGTLNTGALTVNTNGGALNLGSGSVGGALNASSANGNITQTGALTTSGGGTIDAGTGSILLSQANALGGTFNLTGAATRVDNTKTTSTTLTLGTLNTGTLTLNTDGGALDLGSGTVAGALHASSNGGAITQASGGLTVTTGGAVIDAGSGAITLSQANAITGTVDLTGGATRLDNTKTTSTTLTLGTLNTGALTVNTNGGALNLGAGSVSGALNASSANGNITQTGALTTSGGGTLNAGTGTILLNLANALGGSFNLTGAATEVDNTKTTSTTLTLGTLNTGALTVSTSGGALGLGGGTVTGTLNASSAGGAITQASALTVTGNSTLNAGAGAITLSQANALGGTVDLTGGTTRLDNTKATTTTLTLGTVATGALTVNTNGGALNLGAGNVTGSLNAASSGGAITQANGLAVTGGATIDAGSGAITLTAATNNLQGSIDLTGGTTQISNGSGHALTLGTLSTQGLTATTTAAALQLGTGTVTGNLVATSGGAMTQATGGLTVTGTSTLNAGSAAITLADTHNDLQGAVTLTGGATQITSSKTASSVLTLASVTTGALTAITNGGALKLGTGSVTGALNASSHGGAITQATGGLSVSAGATLDAGSGAITLLDASNALLGIVNLTGGITQVANTLNATTTLTLGSVATGNLSVSTAGGALRLGTGTVTGTLAATSGGGAVTQAAGGLVVTGNANVNAGSAAITLADNANDLQGTVTLTGGATQVRSTRNVGSVLTLANLNTGNLTATAGGGTLRLGTGTVTGTLTAASGGGAITQAAGGLVVTGASSLNAGSAAITLGQANDFQGAVSLTGGTTQLANTRNAANALTLGTLNTGNLTATAGGGALNLGTGTVTGTLTAVSGGGAVSQAAGGLVVTGNAGINAGSAAINLGDAGNDWQGSVALTGGATAITSSRSAASTLTLGTISTGNLAATTAGGALTLGTGTVNGALVANSNGGSLGQAAGGITVNSTATLNATLAGDVSLTDTHNHWNGSVQLTGNSLDLRSAGNLGIAALSQPNDRALTLAADGNLSLGAVDLNTGAADLSLTSLGGSFSAGGKLSGRNITLVAQTGLSLARDITASGNLSLGTASGGVDQSAGAIRVTGTGLTTVSAGSSPISLRQTGNHFGGAVQLSGGAAEVYDSGALTLGTLATGNLKATSNGALNLGQGTVTGTLTAASNNGAISQAGALTVTGTASLNAGSGAIALTQAANDLRGAVAVTGGAVALHTAHDLTLSALSQASNQALDLEATGVLTLPGSTTDLDTGTAALTLMSLGGTLKAPGALKGSDITLRGRAVTLAHDVTASGNLDVRATAGLIDQTGGRVAVTGTSLFDAGTQAINLGGTLNDFQGAVSLNGGATQIAATGLHALNLAGITTGSLTISSANALGLGTGTVTGTLTATSAGAMTQAAGGLTVTGSTSLNAGTAAITLTDAANHWAGTVGLSGGDVNLASADALRLSSVATRGLAVSAGGDVDLGTGTVNGALAATTQGTRIGQTGALTVAGASSFIADGSVANLVLDQAGNQLKGMVSVGGINGGSFASVNIVNAADLGFTGDAPSLTLTTSGLLTLGGGRSATLTATAGTGIAQTGALDVSGLTTLVASGAALPVDLSHAGNEFTRVQLTVQPGGGFARVQLRDGDAVRHDGLQVTGDAATLEVTSAGALDLGGGSYSAGLLADTSATGAGITQSGKLSATGLATFKAGTGDVTLTRGDNSLPTLSVASAGTANVASAGNISLGASHISTQLNFALPGTVTLVGPLSGPGELVISGNGSLAVASAQTYSGGTRIQAGSLVLQGAAAQAGSGAVQLGAAGLLDLRDGAVMGNALIAQGGSVLNTSGSGTLAGPVSLQATTAFLPSAGATGLTVSGAISDAGGGYGVRLAGPGSLTLAGSNHYGGTTDISAGTLRATGTGTLPSTSDVLLAAGATLALGQDQAPKSLNGAGSIDLGGFVLGIGADGLDASFSGSIAGSGGLAKLGAGAFTLSGTGSYTGATHVAGGQLVLASATALNDSTAVTVDAGTTLTVQQSASLGSLAGSGTVAVQAPLLSVGANGGNTSFDGTLTGSGGLAKQGGGVMALSGHNTLAGDVQVNGGKLQLATTGVLPGGTAVAVAGGATLELLADQSLGALTGAGQVLLNPNTLTLGATGRHGRFDGVISGSGNLTKAGSGTVTLGGANLYTGATHVASGTLNLAAAQALAGASTLAIDAAGRVQVNAAQAVASLSGAGALELNGAALAVGAGGADSRFDGALSGSGGLTKQGAGTLTLTTAAANSGATVIQAGKLVLTAAGSLGAGEIQNQGSLVLDRADSLTLAQAVTGSGSLVVQRGQVTLASGGNSYSGATQVLGGSLLTTAAERLSDASAVQVAAGAQLQLGGSETIASLQAAGSVHLVADLTTKADQVYTGSLTLANASGITLSGTTIDASHSSNQFAGTPLGLNGGQALVITKESLQLGNVTLSSGGRIEAERLDINGKLQLTGGSLSLVANATPDDTKATPQGIAQVPLAGVNLALAEATVQEGSSGAITVAEGARLAVQAAGGGSVLLAQDANSFKGQLSVLSGEKYDTAWVPNVKGSVGVQSLVRVAGQQLTVGGSGIEADIVSIRADQLATADTSKLVARLPFDETLLGKTLSLPSMTLELAPGAFGQAGNFGVIGGAPIQVEVGSTKTGNRGSGPNAGYLTVLPKGGAQGATVIVLSGPEVGGGTVAPYRFFHDGARQATEIPVVYNGILPLTPSASGALSSINGDAEDARRARFQETVRTENVTVRLRSGVIAEVGPGRASTQGSEGATPPVQCDPAAQPALSCK